MPDAKTLSIAQLKKWTDSPDKKFKLVEVLTRENYDMGHIPGAINIPADDFDEKATQMLKKNETIVLYCRDMNCKLSGRGALYLIDEGYTDVYHVIGGKQTWVEKGFKLEK